ncbi:MAG: hypothetical protein P8L31_04480, partial [Pseudomonadales bacterium]|nr:hypothetical protein [Pseudomonadales bacterium]
MKSTKHLLDPELHPIVDAFPETPLISETLHAFRRVTQENVTLGDADAVAVARSEVLVASADGTKVRSLLYVPKAVAVSRPG